LLRSGLSFDVRKFNAHLEAPQTPPADLTSVAAYDASSQPAVVTVGSLTLATRNSSFVGSAKITNPQSPIIDAHVTIIRLAPADLFLVHGYPLRDNIAGSVNVSGSLDALHTTMALRAGPARADLIADTNLKASQPTYHGELTVAGLDLARLALA